MHEPCRTCRQSAGVVEDILSGSIVGRQSCVDNTKGFGRRKPSFLSTSFFSRIVTTMNDRLAFSVISSQNKLKRNHMRRRKEASSFICCSRLFSASSSRYLHFRLLSIFLLIPGECGSEAQRAHPVYTQRTDTEQYTNA